MDISDINSLKIIDLLLRNKVTFGDESVVDFCFAQALINASRTINLYRTDRHKSRINDKNITELKSIVDEIKAQKPPEKLLNVIQLLNSL